MFYFLAEIFFNICQLILYLFFEITAITLIYIYIYIFFFSSGLIKRFLKDVEWGDLDYLVLDTPPGTSDEHLTLVHYLLQSTSAAALVVTTPQVLFSDMKALVLERGVRICFLP